MHHNIKTYSGFDSFASFIVLVVFNNFNDCLLLRYFPLKFTQTK